MMWLVQDLSNENSNPTSDSRIQLTDLPCAKIYHKIVCIKTKYDW